MTPDDEDHLMLAAYLDGELSPGEVLDMERRLAAEPSLRQWLDQFRLMSGSVRDVVAATPVPETLRSGIILKFANLERLPEREGRRRWPSVAAALLLGLLGGAALDYGASRLGPTANADRTADAVYAGHLRGLIAPQPFDIASSDRHVVKPWFNGRTAIAPEAPDLADQGYPLVGGRVDIVTGEAVPTLVYRRRQHVISVTIVAKAESETAPEIRREGSTIEAWDAGDLRYLAVSDVSIAELRAFVELFRARIASTG